MAQEELLSSQRDNLCEFHDFREPLFTGFLEYWGVVESRKKCATSNTQAANKQQKSQSNKILQRDVFSSKERHLFLFIFC